LYCSYRIAFIEFDNENEAKDAMEEMDGKVFEGRQLKVLVN
jgi:RNA recognition motif-containing protein